jgi:hypothetical protein
MVLLRCCCLLLLRLRRCPLPLLLLMTRLSLTLCHSPLRLSKPLTLDLDGGFPLLC